MKRLYSSMRASPRQVAAVGREHHEHRPPVRRDFQEPLVGLEHRVEERIGAAVGGEATGRLPQHLAIGGGRHAHPHLAAGADEGHLGVARKRVQERVQRRRGTASASAPSALLESTSSTMRMRTGRRDAVRRDARTRRAGATSSSDNDAQPRTVIEHLDSSRGRAPTARRPCRDRRDGPAVSGLCRARAARRGRFRCRNDRRPR